MHRILYHCSKKTELNSNKNCVVVQSKNTEFSSLSLSEIINSLDENASVPSSTEPLKCQECSFETENQKNLEFHSQIHSDLQKCPECGKRSEQFRKTLIDMSTDEEQNEISVNDKNQESDSDFEDEMSNEEMDTSDNNYHRRKKKLCHACSYTTWRSENFVAHCLDHTKEKLFKCEFCDFKTNYRRTIKKHNLKCIKNQKNSFSECFNIAIDEIVNHHILSLSDIINLICSKDKSLDTNTIGLATTEFLKCLECTFETGNQKILKLHLQIHVEVKKCTECNFESKDIETFKDHIVGHFKHKNINEQKMFKCQDCSFATSKSEDFVAHRLGHGNKKLFQCEHCDFKTNYECPLKNHNLKCLKNHKNSLSDCFNKAIDENVDYHSLSLSEIINLICTQDKSLDHNTLDDTTTDVLKCLECPFETGNQKIFNFHSQIHVEVKKCTECNFESKNTETFKDHLIGHFKHKNIEKQKMFKCCDCSYKTKYKSSFDAHCAKHKNIKLFKCDDCDFESNYRKEIILLIFNKRKSLDENPSPAEPLKCSECSFETENQKYLEFHSQIHSDVQKCPECGYESMDTETFKDHLIKIHLDQPTSESESAPSSLRKRSKQFNKTLVDILSDEEKNEITVNDKQQDSNFEDEMSNEEIDTRDNKYLRTKKKFRCHDCSYTTCKSEDFVAHCLNHANKKLLKCEHCDFKTDYRRTIRKHNLKCLKNRKNSLSECFNKAIDESVDYHSLSLSDIINLICSKDKSLNHNTSDETTTEVLTCLECPFETGNQKILNLHSQIHVEGKKCTECNFESKDTATFKDHLRTHLGQSRSDIESVPYSFKSNKTFKESFSNEEHSEVKMKREFVSHLLLHNKDKSDCGYISTNLDNIKVYTLSDIISMICNDEKDVNQDINLDSETKLHKCSQCSFECCDEVQLSQHLSSHSTDEKFICSQCSFEGTNQSDLDSHLQTHSTFKCSKCLCEFSDIVSWNSHRCELKSDKFFKCLTCNFETKNKKHFILHSQIHAKLRKCTECNFSHLRRDKFQSHLMTHLPKKLYSCTECGYKTNHIHELKVHFLNHAGKKVFHCPKCNYNTNQKQNLKNHIENHSEFKSYRCSECNYSTSKSCSLRLHILDHSQKKLFLCSECDYGCNYKARMSRHVLQHSREKLYKCSRCDFETNFMKNLKDHEARRHGGSFSYACSHCDFKCYKRSSLKSHSVIHSKTKLLKCPECSYECNYNLKLHMINMHSKSKMYKCSQCKYEGNHRSNFLTHIRTHSSDRNYSCSECSFTSKRKDNLKTHLMTHLKEKLFKMYCKIYCVN
ncbi:Zinc finger protein 91 [Armadillidium nasatum]|uniref:Zinc finger protein 91 n=1 Tax=Armadillidium nasatum TaxID=96803 RepID=A0A5N5TB95_9CRUS|nr:Zinc finger protein 91 [Armadillidium nasatum]